MCEHTPGHPSIWGDSLLWCILGFQLWLAPYCGHIHPETQQAAQATCRANVGQRKRKRRGWSETMGGMDPQGRWVSPGGVLWGPWSPD